MEMASLWVTRKPYCGPGVGHQVWTLVIAPGRFIQIAARQPWSWRWPSSGNHVSCVPQPSSAGWKPSATKPSTDQVLTKVPMRLGRADFWVSRSAICTPLTPRDCISRAQPSRVVGAGASAPVSRASRSSASFTNQDTMPGFAPQHDTAVVPPGFAAFSSRIACLRA
jgi:hypothetical protein